LVSALLSACGGGGGAGDEVVVGVAAAPLTFSVAPANGATGVDLLTTVSVTATETLNASTVNSATFVLAEVGGGPVVGLIAVSGNTATFTPDVPLNQNTQYMATVTTGVTSTGGKAPLANFSLTFTTVTLPGAP